VDAVRRGRNACDRHSEAGFIIVAVLWILAALTALVAVYSVHVVDTAYASKLGGDRLEAEVLIEAGVELTVERLTAGIEKTPPPSGSFTSRVGSTQVGVTFRSEGARIDLNVAKKDLLVGLFTVLGADPDAAATFADRIIGWRRKTDAGGRNEEVEAYRLEDSGSLPRQAPFQNVAELRLVGGLPPELVERMLPYVTVFNGRAEIDPMVADPTVLLALPKMTRSIVEEVVDARTRGEQRRVLDLLAEARSSVATEPRKATRIDVYTTLAGGRRVAAEVVVLAMDGGFDPYRILSWKDDFDRPGA
jgi:general secretion pathway protein K